MEQCFAVRERRYAVSVLSAEIAHELATSRLYLQGLVAHAPLEEADREARRDEVARLDRLLGRLRRARNRDGLQAEVPLLPVV
ncbi:MAG: hypothetical protein L0Y64_04125 [Myxococcaceae bacterium]|nr:hypothetical protein [Myxococcaceae bacterium]